MIGNLITTPFGRRAMSLGHLKAQSRSQTIEPGKSVDKWQVYRWLCEGKEIVGVGDRALAVLNALLSFLPDSELAENTSLIVFPSNVQLSMRAHGMANATLRRHLATLVECGLVTRKDSPNGKRYSRKGRGGEITEAFGFSLAPLLARAEEFEAAAARVRTERYALKLARERLTLHRRDIAKLLEVIHAEAIAGDWQRLWTRFRVIVEAIPRQAELVTLERIVAELLALHEEIAIALENQINAENLSGNESRFEPQQQNSHSDSRYNLEAQREQNKPEKTSLRPEAIEQVANTFPLGMVLKACREISDYSPGSITTWRDLVATTAQVRCYLGISSSAYKDALDILGHECTAIVIACILEKAHQINSPGGYLRALTDRARTREFSVGPMLMACLRSTGSHLHMVPK